MNSKQETGPIAPETSPRRESRQWLHPLALILWIVLLGFFFAEFEIQVEGPHGWAANLPTWRIESHPLLDLFWGGKPLTGYHLWIFSFMALAFHLPMLIFWKFSVKLETRVLGSVMLFWIAEDLLWFILNPAFGIARFKPEFVPWHKYWILGVPTDYIVFVAAGAACIWYSFAARGERRDDVSAAQCTPATDERDPAGRAER